VIRKPAAPQAAAVRCAIYTLKSTENGLEQEFNSLDAQRESAEAFFKSQASLGWQCLPDRYEDGGFTGGNMDRPALRQLLQDIESDKVDSVADARRTRHCPQVSRQGQGPWSKTGQPKKRSSIWTRVFQARGCLCRRCDFYSGATAGPRLRTMYCGKAGQARHQCQLDDRAQVERDGLHSPQILEAAAQVCQ
jgi:hypothetical protein